MFNSKEIKRLQSEIDKLEDKITERRKQAWADVKPCGIGIWTGYSTGEHYTGEEIHKRFNEIYEFLGVERKTSSGTKLEKKL